jgi:hypothetical protein
MLVMYLDLLVIIYVNDIACIGRLQNEIFLDAQITVENSSLNISVLG